MKPSVGRFRALLLWSGPRLTEGWRLLDYFGPSAGRQFLEDGIYRRGIAVPLNPDWSPGWWVLEGRRINERRVRGWWRRPADVEVHRLYHRLPVWYGA